MLAGLESVIYNVLQEVRRIPTAATKRFLSGGPLGPDSSLRPFGPALNPSDLLDFVLCSLRALRPCDPRNGDEEQESLSLGVRMWKMMCHLFTGMWDWMMRE